MQCPNAHTPLARSTANALLFLLFIYFPVLFCHFWVFSLVGMTSVPLSFHSSPVPLLSLGLWVGGCEHRSKQAAIKKKELKEVTETLDNYVRSLSLVLKITTTVYPWVSNPTLWVVSAFIPRSIMSERGGDHSSSCDILSPTHSLTIGGEEWPSFFFASRPLFNWLTSFSPFLPLLPNR